MGRKTGWREGSSGVEGRMEESGRRGCCQWAGKATSIAKGAEYTFTDTVCAYMYVLCTMRMWSILGWGWRKRKGREGGREGEEETQREVERKS
jgi:hypothetical protein